MSWLSGYLYRKLKPVNATAAGAQTDYQVKLKVGESSGSPTPDIHCEEHCEDFPNDIRFTGPDEQSKHSYWVESITGESPNRLAKIHIKIPTIPSEGSIDLYMYYGKSADSGESNGDNTFLFFDDFDGDSLNAISTSGDIVVSGDANKYEAWPGIAKYSNGDLFAVYRTCDTNTHSYCSTGKVVIRKSTDDGQSWGSEITIVDAVNNDERNANILIFDNDGTETILVVYNTHNGTGSADRVYIKKSIDGGNSWGNAIAITPGSERRAYGVPILLSNGKILIPIDNSMSPWKVFVIESSDGGDNWTEYEVATDAVHQINEMSIIETKTEGSFTGGVYAIVRTEVSPYTYYKTTSTDYGHNWSALSAVTDISNTHKTPISLYRAPNGEILSVRSTNGDDLVIHESTNECVNWIDKKTIVSNASISGYPHMISINSSELVIVWCENGATSDVYVNFVDYPLSDYKWIVNAGAPSVSNSILEMTGTCKIYSNQEFNQGIAYESKVYIKDIRSAGFVEQPFDFGGDTATITTQPSGRGFTCERNGDNWWQDAIYTKDSWKRHKITWMSSDVYIYENETEKGHKATSDGSGIPADDMPIYLYVYSTDVELLKYDWLFVREFAFPEPTWGSSGGESESKSKSQSIISII